MSTSATRLNMVERQRTQPYDPTMMIRPCRPSSQSMATNGYGTGVVQKNAQSQNFNSRDQTLDTRDQQYDSRDSRFDYRDNQYNARDQRYDSQEPQYFERRESLRGNTPLRYPSASNGFDMGAFQKQHALPTFNATGISNTNPPRLAGNVNFPTAEQRYLEQQTPALAQQAINTNNFFQPEQHSGGQQLGSRNA